MPTKMNKYKAKPKSPADKMIRTGMKSIKSLNNKTTENQTTSENGWTNMTSNLLPLATCQSISQFNNRMKARRYGRMMIRMSLKTRMLNPQRDWHYATMTG